MESGTAGDGSAVGDGSAAGEQEDAEEALKGIVYMPLVDIKAAAGSPVSNTRRARPSQEELLAIQEMINQGPPSARRHAENASIKGSPTSLIERSPGATGVVARSVVSSAAHQHVAAPAERGASSVQTVPTLLVRIEQSQATAAIDLAFLSPTASSRVCLPPGVYLEQRKETTENLPVGGLDGGEIEAEIEAKVLEVEMHLPPYVARQAAALADAKAEGRTTRTTTGARAA